MCHNPLHQILCIQLTIGIVVRGASLVQNIVRNCLRSNVIELVYLGAVHLMGPQLG